MLEKVSRWCYLEAAAGAGRLDRGVRSHRVPRQRGGGKYTTDYNTPGSDSKAAYDLLTERFPDRAGDPISVVFNADAGVNDPAVRQSVESLLAKLAQ